ncbi:MAG: ATP-binding cassette domain-containing protein [Chlamydiae bacterium]|nr:ATP-binding cassette domain-containing protein [Chlamydiota bacterium]
MEITNLSYRHHKKAPLFFDGMSFHLEKGRLHALHGKNGSGKTVLLQVLYGKVPEEAVLEGEVTGNEAIALVNQRFDQMIADQFSFEENMRFALLPKHPSPFSFLKATSLYRELLTIFSIDIHRPVHTLSGGQRQILSLLMVLQKNKKILLLDEPTAALDEENAKLVFAFLQELAYRGFTLLVVCHDRELVSEYATGVHFYLDKRPDGLRVLHPGG